MQIITPPPPPPGRPDFNQLENVQLEAQYQKEKERILERQRQRDQERMQVLQKQTENALKYSVLEIRDIPFRKSSQNIKSKEGRI